VLRGVDVAEFQGDINWDRVRRAGIRFAGVKATEGEDFVDVMSTGIPVVFARPCCRTIATTLSPAW
jgi:glycosyl hydrolase family 25